MRISYLVDVKCNVKRMQTSNEKAFNKNRVIMAATKGQKQMYVFQRNAFTSLIHFVHLCSKVD